MFPHPQVILALNQTEIDPLLDKHLWAHVTVRNPDPFPVTVHLWDSPLDRSTAALGVFKLYAKEQPDQVIDVRHIFFSRIVPSDYREYHVEIPQNGEIGKTHMLVDMLGDFSRLELKDGRYIIRAEGFWRGLWPCGVEEMTKEMVEKSGGWSQPSLAFKSEGVEIAVDASQSRGKVPPPPDVFEIPASREYVLGNIAR